jgi:hypothetical protein
MAFSGMLRSVALVRTADSEELTAFFIRVTRIGELGTTLAEPHGVTSQKIPFFFTGETVRILTTRRSLRKGARSFVTRLVHEFPRGPQ